MKFVSAADEPASYLMVETDDEVFAQHIAHGLGEKRLRKPFVRAEVHQGAFDSPDDDSETFDGVRVWELPF